MQEASLPSPSTQLHEPVQPPTNSVPKPDRSRTDALLAEIECELQDRISKRDAARGAMNEIHERTASHCEERDEICKLLDNYRNEKETLIATRNKISSCLAERTKSLSSIQESVAGLSDAQMQRKVQELENRHTTESTSLKDEKELVREIDEIRSKRITIANSTDECTRLETEREELKTQLAELREKLDMLRARVQEQHSKLLSLDAQNDDSRKFAALKRERVELDQQISDLLERKRQVLNDWKTENQKYFEYSKQIKLRNELEHQTELERKRVEHEAVRKAWEAEEAKKKPWLEEMALCDFLISYLDQLSCSTENHNNANVPHRIPAQNTVANNDDETVKCDVNTHKIQHTHDLISSFELLQVTPPTDKSEIPKCCEELKAKRQHFDTLPRK